MRKPLISPTPTVRRYRNRDGMAFGPFVSDLPVSLAYSLMRLMKDLGDWNKDFFCTHDPRDLGEGKHPLRFSLWTEKHVYFLTGPNEAGYTFRDPSHFVR